MPRRGCHNSPILRQGCHPMLRQGCHPMLWWRCPKSRCTSKLNKLFDGTTRCSSTVPWRVVHGEHGDTMTVFRFKSLMFRVLLHNHTNIGQYSVNLSQFEVNRPSKMGPKLCMITHTIPLQTLAVLFFETTLKRETWIVNRPSKMGPELCEWTHDSSHNPVSE